MKHLDDLWNGFCKQHGYDKNNDDMKAGFCGGIIGALLGGHKCHKKCKDEWEAKIFAESVLTLEIGGALAKIEHMEVENVEVL